MKHDLYDREDDLHHCKVCGGAEGSLPTDCPGNMMDGFIEESVMAEIIDHADGRWILRKIDDHPDSRKVAQLYGRSITLEAYKKLFDLAELCSESVGLGSSQWATFQILRCIVESRTEVSSDQPIDDLRMARRCLIQIKTVFNHHNFTDRGGYGEMIDKCVSTIDKNMSDTEVPL